jgi:hypothetical protein
LRQPCAFGKTAIFPFKASGDGIPSSRLPGDFPFSDYHAFPDGVKGWKDDYLPVPSFT